MRVDLSKWLFVGPQEQKELFFQQAQHAGLIEFTGGRSNWELTPDQLSICEALRTLKHHPAVTPALLDEAPLEVARRCNQAAEQLEQSTEAITQIQKELQHLAVLGEFSQSSLQQIAQEGKLIPRFVYTNEHPPKSHPRLFELSVHEGTHYFLWLGSRDDSLPEGFVSMQVEQDPGQLREQLSREQKRQIEAMTQLSHCKAFEEALRQQLAELLSETDRHHAVALARPELCNRLFVVHGWVANSRRTELQALLAPLKVVAVVVELAEGELMPTYLENKALARLGEDLVSIYDVPAHDDRDPSLWVLTFFALFFAMIVGDGGYGLIFLAAALYAYFKWKPLEALAQRVKQLALLLSLSCVIWGVIAGSFFGLQLGPSNRLRQISLVHQLSLAKVRYHWRQHDATYQAAVLHFPELASLDSPQEILEKAVEVGPHGTNYRLMNEMSDQVSREMALAVGVIHLLLSMIRYVRRNWPLAGWSLFLIGGWLYFPEVVGAVTFVNYLLGLDPAISAARGLELLYTGVALSVALAVIKQRWSGLLELMNLVQVFSDAMSYLRLYALGLTGAVMAATFNSMAESKGLVCGGLILITGHAINLVLAVTGGVTHGLRLNFIEWYHYSFSGGGRWHRPLKKIDWNESSSR